MLSCVIMPVWLHVFTLIKIQLTQRREGAYEVSRAMLWTGPGRSHEREIEKKKERNKYTGNHEKPPLKVDVGSGSMALPPRDFLKQLQPTVRRILEPASARPIDLPRGAGPGEGAQWMSCCR